MFGTFAVCFLNKFSNGSVVGASYDGTTVKHIIINSIDGIKRLQNSKYVQSNTTAVFKEIQKLLEQGKPVLFSGTPCQVYSLRLYLNKDYPMLYLIDIICHGVPSPAFLKKDIAHYGNNVIDVKFRTKKKFFKSGSGFILDLKKTSGVHKYVLSNRDPYFSMFMNNFSFRESCYSCDFSNLNRISDITLVIAIPVDIIQIFIPRNRPLQS
jgi:coenzyme F420-reducing hydrogenase beta subunit